MDHFIPIAIAFGASLAATIVVALLLRIGGEKPNLWNDVAIPVGITAAEAVRLRWQLLDIDFASCLARPRA